MCPSTGVGAVPSHFLAALGVTGKLWAKMHAAHSKNSHAGTNRMCPAECSRALKMGEKLVFYFLACVHVMSWVPREEVIWSRWTVTPWIYQLTVAGLLSWCLNPFFCNSPQWRLCKNEIVTMQTLWWPSPLLGLCILADPKRCLRCRYVSFVSGLHHVWLHHMDLPLCCTSGKAVPKSAYTSI